MASGDHGFAAPGLYGTADDNTYSGALSFLRRRYTRDLAGVDVVVSGIAYDLGTSNRAGSRFGPRGLRQASSHIAWGPQWPFDFDPTHRLAIVDWGDHNFAIGYTDAMMAAVEANVGGFLKAGCFPMTMGGDHFVTLPLLRAVAGFEPVAAGEIRLARETIDRIEVGRRVSGPVRIALEVPDSSATAARLIAAGAEQMAPPVLAPWGDRNVRLRDPSGMQLTLFTSP